MRVRKLTPPDRSDLVRLLEESGTFNDEEVRVAVEVIDDALAQPGVDYHVLVGEDAEGRVQAYICFGPTPMTECTFDLYWLATHPAARGQGLGSRLVRAMEAELSAAPYGAVIVRVETSKLEAYGAAHKFYAHAGYAEAGRIKDFYKPGDDLIILAKRLEARPKVAEPRGRVVLETDAL
jgi:ribosomal protein S18 acetylase RimI-like enzyme